MSSEHPPEGAGVAAEAPVVSPALRRRLQQCYEHAKKLMAQPKYDHDYAFTALAECIAGDPSTVAYTDAFLENLNKKYNNNLKGASMQMFLPRGPLKKALAAKQWQEALKAGAARILKTNPWDAATLRGMAEACENLQCSESELRYLKNAIDGNPKDADVARHCAKSLARVGQYDQAIGCWNRVAEIKKNDPEAMKMMGDLQVEKTKWRLGLLTKDEKTNRPVAAKQKLTRPGEKPTDEFVMRPAAEQPKQSPDLVETKPYVEPQSRETPSRQTQSHEPQSQSREVQLKPWQRLEKAIQDDPSYVDNYVQLADAYTEDGKLPDAERALQRGLQVAGGDLRLRERLEDVQIMRARQQLAVAEKRAKAEETDAAKELVKQLKDGLNRLELDMFGQRAERYPVEAKWKYELGVRLKRSGNYSEAIKRLGEINGDSTLAALVQLETGECLQYLKQYQRSLEAYRKAIDLTAKAGDTEHLKLALYRGGVLAVGMHDAAGREFLSRLVDLDPAFRDAKARLAKLS